MFTVLLRRWTRERCWSTSSGRSRRRTRCARRRSATVIWRRSRRRRRRSVMIHGSLALLPSRRCRRCSRSKLSCIGPAYLMLIWAISYVLVLVCYLCSSSMIIGRLEHGVYSLARVRDGAMNRYRGYHIPWEWMQDTGIVSQVIQCFSFQLLRHGIWF